MGPQGLTGPAGKSFDPFRITRDLGDLCQAVKQVQAEMDKFRFTLWSPNFTFRSCSYYY